MQITVGIITISDRASGGEYEDRHLEGPGQLAARQGPARSEDQLALSDSPGAVHLPQLCQKSETFGKEILHVSFCEFKVGRRGQISDF